MKFILKYLKPFAKRMSLGFTIKVLGTVVELFLPYILSHILENVVLNGRIQDVVYWGLLMVACAGRLEDHVCYR